MTESHVSERSDSHVADDHAHQIMPLSWDNFDPIAGDADMGHLHGDDADNDVVDDDDDDDDDDRSQRREARNPKRNSVHNDGTRGVNETNVGETSNGVSGALHRSRKSYPGENKNAAQAGS